MTVGVGDFSSRPLLYMNVLHEHWALVLVGALMNLRLGDLKCAQILLLMFLWAYD